MPQAEIQVKHHQLMRSVRTVLLVVGIASSFLWIAFSARAQIAPSLGVSPEKFELSLVRGGEWSGDIKIANLGADALPIRLTPVRWEARDEVGGINFVAAPEDPSFDIIQWMEVSDRDFILDPGETKRVAVTLRVPQDAEPGGKYGAIFIEPTLPEFYFAQDASRTIPQIGVLFLIDIPVLTLEGEIVLSARVEQFEIEGQAPALSAVASRIASLFRSPLRAFAADPPVSVEVLSRSASAFVLRIRNEGLTHIRPRGTLTVHNLFGREVARAELAPTTILPGRIRQFPVELSAKDSFLPQTIERQLAFGRYTATIVLEEVGAEPLLARLAYWIFPWKLLLPLLAVFTPLLFFTYRFRARLLAAFRVLFRRPS